MNGFRCAVLFASIVVAFSASAGDTYRFDKGVVVVGDTIAMLVARAGQPDREVQLENKFGGAVGQRYEYYIGEKFVAFTIENGRIVRIDEQS